MIKIPHAFAILFTLICSFPMTVCATNKAQPDSPIIVGYYEQWGIYSPNVHIHDLPLEHLTHLIYLAADVNEQGEVILGDVYSDIQNMYADQVEDEIPFGGNFRQLVIAKPFHPHLHTLISIGGWSRSEYFSRLANQEDTRNKLATSVIEFMTLYQFDGVEIDWQFPIEDNSITDSQRPEDVENFTKLLANIRQLMDQKSVLTGKQYLLAAASHQRSASVEKSLAEAANALDFITLTTSYINGYWNKKTNHISPIYTPDYIDEGISVDTMVQKHLKAGIPANKIIFDVSPFAIGWQGIQTNNDNGLYAEANRASWGTWEQNTSPNGVYSRKHLQNLIKAKGYKRHWDDEAKSVYLFNPDRFGGHFISYEDEQSIKSKIDYIEKHDLAGIAIRKLHSDTRNSASLAYTVYGSFHPLRNAWLRWQEFYQKNHSTFLITIPILLLIIFFLISWKIHQYRRKQAKLLETDQFYWMRDQLQLLEWPLTQMQLATGLTEDTAQKLKINKLQSLPEISAKLLKPITYLLTRTKLNQSNRSINIQSISGFDLSNQVILAVSSNLNISSEKIDISIANDVNLYSDPIYLVQLIVELCSLLQENNADAQNTINMVGKPKDDTAYELTIINPKTNVKQFEHHIFLQIKDIYKIAQPLGINIEQLNGSEGIGFRLYIPTINTPQSHFLSSWSTASKTQDAKQLFSTSANKFLRDQNSSKNANHLSSLHHFSQVESPTRDIGKLVNQACEYFTVSLKKPLKISIYQDQHLVAQMGEDIESSVHEENYEMGEFQFLIQSSQVLEMEDIQYFSALMNQIQLVRKALQEIMKEPALLSELYELATKKDKLSYLKADKGYSAIYLSNEISPHYISLRLRTIKQYFEDEALLQIHRSYLVNPKKVTRVVQINKLKFELEINNTRLPISRPYIPTLKKRHPHWFTGIAHTL